jgi:NAD+ synthase (glutamine-hydrolysing)
MRIALAQMNPTVGDIDGNAALIVDWLRRARTEGAEVIIFPELAVAGYPPEDLLLKDHFVTRCMEALEMVAGETRGIVALVGSPWREDGVLHNGAAILAEGKVAGWYAKVWLPNYGVFDEKRYFAPGARLMVARVRDVRIGVTVCEDIWVEDGPGEMAVFSGSATVIANLSMSPYHRGKGQQREVMLGARAREAQAHVCYVNGVGGQDELVFDGQSLVFGPEGELMARAAQFEEELLVVDIDPGPPREPNDGPLEVREIEVAGLRGSGPARPTDRGPALGRAGRPATRLRERLGPEAEVYEALRVGIRDYVGKNGFSQVVMGISGGIDSALTACIAADALGADKVTTVSMPSRYSSVGTKTDARETAERLGVHYLEIPIEGLYEAYLACLSSYLAPGSPGVTEQNIQARIRGNLLMALSNKFGWLVLTTGNKSETAVGYATLYGDMAGGFAALKDVPKTLVYELAKYRNALGPAGGPIPATTLERAPSAELAPGQTDQDTLPPYDVLDQIIEAYVERDDSLDEIVALGLDRALVRRVLNMIDGNEYKRRQGAPGVKITPRAFGKDRRLPITNRYRG